MFNAPPVDQVEAAFPEWRFPGSFLGKGTFKVAYAAERNGLTEALKLFHVPDFGSAPEDQVDKQRFMARLEREIKLLKECKSPHLVKLGTLDPVNVSVGGIDFVAYTEELLDGESLSSLIGRIPLPSAQHVAKLMLNTAIAVNELWQSHRCVHRDIKPDNIRLVSDSNRGFVLLDLGITFDAEGTRLTDASISPGTPAYRAPEMFKADYWNNLNERTDMYCIGVTAFEYASGVHPLDTGSRSSVTSRILKEAPLKLLTVRPDFDPKLAKLIDQLNRKQPSLRGGLLALISQLEKYV